MILGGVWSYSGFKGQGISITMADLPAPTFGLRLELGTHNHMSYCHISGKPRGHGSYKRTLAGPIII